MAEVRLFGGVEFEGPLGTTSFSGGKQRAIVARLALDPGRAVSTEALIDDVWGDEVPHTVRASLQTHISQIRRTLADIGVDDVLRTDPAGYVLAVDRSAIDLNRFEQLVRRAESSAVNDSEDGLDLALEALDVWAGPPFAGTGRAPFVERVSARLERRRLDLAGTIAEGAIASGRVGEVVGVVEQLASAHPYDEQVWASLARLLYADCRQADALATLSGVRRRLRDDLGLDPTAIVGQLEHQMLIHDSDLQTVALEDVTANAGHPRHNLPARATSYIRPAGRLESIGNLLSAHPLVTIVGPGGSGKTRTSTELAATQLDRFPDGAWFVELAPVSDPAAVVGAVAATLSVTMQAGRSALDSLLEWCRGRRALLILDNCEHVLGAAADVVAAILLRCPTISVIATSREPLGLEGEQVHVLELLDSASATTLFVERATLADATFDLDGSDAQDVVDLCARLDRVPLAIELAAAHIRWMSPVEMAERIGARLPLVAADSRSRPARHHTLQAAVSWSYDLLTDAGRRLFDRLSVFAGTFDLAAVEAVCPDEDDDIGELLAELGRLVNKSMVVSELREAGRRFRLLDTMRHFAAERLTDRGEDHAIRSRHMRHYTAIAERADVLARGPRELEALVLFEDAWDNVRIAHSWAVTCGDIDHAERITRAARLFAQLSMTAEVLDWMLRTIELATPERQPHADVFGGAAEWAERLQRMDLMASLLRRGLEVASAMDGPDSALCWAAMPHWQHWTDDPDLMLLLDWLGDLDCDAMFERAASQLDTDFDWWALVWLVEGTGASNPHLERLVETAQRVRAPSLQAFAALYEGHHLIQFAGPAGVNEAAAKYHEALTIARGVRNQFVEGEALRAHLFAIVQAADDDRAALRVCRDVLTSLHESRRLDRLDTVLRSTALLLARCGSLEAASVIFGRVQANLAGWGYEYNLGFDDEIIRLTASDPARQRWVARGSHMTLDEAVLYALDQLPTDQEQPARRVTVDVGERDVESAGAAGGPG